MALDTGLRTLLLARGDILALVPDQVIGGVTFRGVFNEDPQQGFLPPFILISRISADPWLTLGTTGKTGAIDFDIDCYAYTLTTALAIDAVVQAFIEDYTGPAGTSDTIKAVLMGNKRHDKIFEAEGRDVRQHIVSTTYTIQASYT
jgi:hypothetical protein